MWILARGIKIDIKGSSELRLMCKGKQAATSSRWRRRPLGELKSPQKWFRTLGHGKCRTCPSREVLVMVGTWAIPGQRQVVDVQKLKPRLVTVWGAEAKIRFGGAGCGAP